MTDCATFAYLADLFVMESHRGRGFSKWMMGVVFSHTELQGFWPRKMRAASTAGTGSYRIRLNGGALRLVARRAFPSVIPAKLVPAKAGSGNPRPAREVVPGADGPLCACHAPGFGIGTSSRAASGF